MYKNNNFHKGNNMHKKWVNFALFSVSGQIQFEIFIKKFYHIFSNKLAICDVEDACVDRGFYIPSIHLNIIPLVKLKFFDNNTLHRQWDTNLYIRLGKWFCVNKNGEKYS